MSKKVSQLRLEIIRWNNRFPLDRIWRQKHNVAFGSEEHRAVSQLDIYLEWLEDELYKEAEQRAQDSIKREKEFEKGIWLRDTTTTEDDDLALFDKISVSEIPDSPIEII